MIKAEVQWLQTNDQTRLDYDVRYAADLIGLVQIVPLVLTEELQNTPKTAYY